jgi:hypothetical protein
LQVITAPPLIGRIYADEVRRRDCPKNIVDMRSHLRMALEDLALPKLV